MLEKILKKYWGYESFRPLQKEIMESLLDGKDTLGILPTGGGKSLTFQIPGLVREGLTIVVTPLISLMKDQVENLRKRKIQGVYLHSGMTMREKRLVNERIFHNKAKFLYISPERLSSDSFLAEIKNIKVNFIVVDEAHCISQWGYDFRPSYLKVNRLRKIFPSSPVLALTASATREVEEDICRQLNFGRNGVVFRNSIERSNLSYVVRPSEGKLHDIYGILNSVGGTAIVYVRSRKRTREIAEYLHNMGISATYYHAGLEPEQKEEHQNRWKAGEDRVMVATNAFGMGIDKGDVRTVIHFDLPPSLEEYYQEAGRAGRDGKQAYAVLLTSKTDKGVLHRRLTIEFPPKETIRNIYTRLCVFSKLEIGEGYGKCVEFDIDQFCRTFDLNETTVRASLKILGQAGYIEFLEEFENSSRVMVSVERDELYKVKLSSPLHETLLTALLRNYPGLFTDYVFVNEKKLAYLTQLPPENIYELLVGLSKYKIISYIPRRKTPMLYFPTSMEEERYIEIGKSVYEERKEIFRRRIEAMIDYSSDTVCCKLNKLMAYFGEDVRGTCGHCDSCRKEIGKKHKEKVRKNVTETLQRMLCSNPEGLNEENLRMMFGKQYEDAEKALRDMAREGIIMYNSGIWKLN